MSETATEIISYVIILEVYKDHFISLFQINKLLLFRISSENILYLLELNRKIVFGFNSRNFPDWELAYIVFFGSPKFLRTFAVFQPIKISFIIFTSQSQHLKGFNFIVLTFFSSDVARFLYLLTGCGFY